ncbi:hypothetical protein G6M02_00035 [Agrobacterium rhizogenes]|nr:hypothetical protein [Rhizobium rhizogenes]
MIDATDPLLDAIQSYRQGVRDLNAIPIEEITLDNEDELIASTYGKSDESSPRMGSTRVNA